MSERKITRWEYLQNMTAREAGHYFCEQIENYYTEYECRRHCPVRKMCYEDGINLNGFQRYFKEAWDE